MAELISEYKFFLFRNKECWGPYLGAFIKYSEAEEIKDEWLLNSSVWNGGTNNAIHTFGDNYLYSYSIGTISGYQFYIKKKLVLDGIWGIGVRNIYKRTNIISGSDSQYGLGWTGIFVLHLM